MWHVLRWKKEQILDGRVGRNLQGQSTSRSVVNVDRVSVFFLPTWVVLKVSIILGILGGAAGSRAWA
jgi:hypothetical protein